jgi:hypothetical protein
LSEPLVPEIVMWNVPVDVPRGAVTVRVDDVPVVGLGLKVANAPIGRPLAVKLTDPLNPFVRVMATE